MLLPPQAKEQIGVLARQLPPPMQTHVTPQAQRDLPQGSLRAGPPMMDEQRVIRPDRLGKPHRAPAPLLAARRKSARSAGGGHSRGDNTKIAVAQILGDGTRQKTRAFSELQSHYLFAERFGRPGKGNDKGKVEGLVGYARRNFLVPLPRVSSYDALNQHLRTGCQERRAKVLRGHQDTIGKRFEWDRQALPPLPPVPYEACEKQATRVSSLSLVRYRANDYSVPVEFGHREVVMKGYVHEVAIHCGTQEIARHARSYEKHDAIYEPRHYLPLLDQAAPLAEWELPEEFARMRRLLESRQGKKGKREYVQILRLLEHFTLTEVQASMQQALQLQVKAAARFCCSTSPLLGMRLVHTKASIPVAESRA